jgi:methyl-accepting chemotaxis protein
MKTNEKSLKLKLILIVSLIIFAISGSLSVILIKQAEDKIIEETKKSGMGVVGDMEKALVLSNTFNHLIDDVLSERVEIMSYLLGQKPDIDNDYLKKISNKFGISELNFANSNGEILFSNLSENLGYVYQSDHAMAKVIAGEEEFVSEPIRISLTNGKSYKYGGARLDDGNVIQIGIEPKVIEELKSTTSYQSVIEKNSSRDDILYALVIDPNFIAVAHSIPDRIGLDLSEDSSVQEVMKTSKEYCTEFNWNYNDTLHHAYDCLVPLIIDGNLEGIINVGISLEAMDESLSGMKKRAIIITLISVIISIILLYFLINKSLKPLINLSKIAALSATGDLRNTVDVKSKDEIGNVANSFNLMVTSLRKMIEDINKITNGVFESTSTLVESTEQIAEVTNQIASATQEVAHGTENQVSAINEASKNVCEVVQNIQTIQDEAISVSNEAFENNKTVKAATNKVNNMTNQMGKIKDSVLTASKSMDELKAISLKIGEIVNIINSIADQTNLLALNASIEAARAGEHGKGFAVVAEEIRKLAEESRSSTENIKNLITQTQSSTGDALKAIELGSEEAIKGEELLEEVKISFKTIDDGVSLTMNSMETLKNQANIIHESMQSVEKMIGKVESISQASAANSEEVAASTEEQSSAFEEIVATIKSLEEMMDDLKKSVDTFTY